MISNPLVYEYNLSFKNGDQVSYKMTIDTLNNRLVIDDVIAKQYKDFVNLEFNKCKNCPFNKESKPVCPVALSIAAIVNVFKNHKSTERVDVEVVSNERTYLKNNTDLQTALQSIYGLSMACSGCPHFSFLTPMAYTHLPFANSEETILRAIGTFMIGEYFADPSKPVDLTKLHKRYSELEIINRGMLQRIRDIQAKDASLNAIVILDSFIKIFHMEFSINLENLRGMYLGEGI